MSDLRTAANQMLEALEGGADSWQLVGPAIDALKEALVESDIDPVDEYRKGFIDGQIDMRDRPAEPVQEPGFWGRVAARQASRIAQLETTCQQALDILDSEFTTVDGEFCRWCDGRLNAKHNCKLEQSIVALKTALSTTREHITDGSPCWCSPELNYVDPDTGVKVWVHKEPQ